MNIRLTADQIKTGLATLSKPRTIRKKGKPVQLPPRVVIEDARIALTETHHAEVQTAKHLRRLLDAVAAAPALEVPADVFGAGFTPDASQREAVELAARSGVIVLTGGPGTGKTTVAKAMLKLFEDAGLSVVCCAPTGKAAQRMKEQTGREAATIHRTIGMIPGSEPRHHAGNPLPCNVLVVDETSMVDATLAATVLAAVPTGARLLIIGDVDQLPSIGAGRVLFDLIASGAVPTVRLTKIHRQASESRIPYVARDLNEGRCPDLNVTGSDVTHWETAGADEIADRIVRAVTEALPERKGFASADIQVLAAQYDDSGDAPGACGVVGLNIRLQAALNPADNAEGDVFINRRYSCRTSDRVIHIRNNYDLSTMNGEIGRVVAADPRGLLAQDFLDAHWSGKDGDQDGDEDGFDGSDSDVPPGTKLVVRDGEEVIVFEEPRVIAVKFEDGNGGRVVLYTKAEAKELELAYCITVHKSQGSQFKAVVIATPKNHGFMLTRALLYTAVTRAEKFCLMVGQADQVAASARNTRGSVRRTSLQERLQS
jgi:exodeoxyribonuclease V alpha subunit